MKRRGIFIFCKVSDYLQITFSNLQPEQRDILIAQLSDAGFEGFEEKENSLEAFIKSNEFDNSLLDEIVFKYQLQYKISTLINENWKKVWEIQFQPVIVKDFVAVRADFHEPVSNVELEIIITPKMSFGTGHHATTYMMIEQMREIDFSGKSVFDFGTGTGILAILAEKLGANYVLAIDIDEWSIENAEENIKKNCCNKIELKKTSIVSTEKKFDVILANINKNVILDYFHSLINLLNASGVLLLSGLIEEDYNDIVLIAVDFGLKMERKLIKSNWICIKFTY